MRFGYFTRWFPSVLVALGISTLALSPAHVSGIVVIEDGAVSKGGDLAAAAGACVLEPMGPRTNSTIAFGPEEAYTAIATLIDPASCLACPAPASLDLNSVKFRLRWWNACSATAEVSVVGVTGAPGCPAPDLGNVLCAPVSYEIAGFSVTGGVEHTLAFPSACCIDGPAFVLVKFTGLLACAGTSTSVGPIVSTLSPLPACTQYFSTSSSYPTLTDVNPSLGLPLWVNVDADCCDPTPTLPGSWGRLKTLYH